MLVVEPLSLRGGYPADGEGLSGALREQGRLLHHRFQRFGLLGAYRFNVLVVEPLSLRGRHCDAGGAEGIVQHGIDIQLHSLGHVGAHFPEQGVHFQFLDDVHTASAWSILEKFTSIPVEHITIERIKQNKSLVDIRLTARACQEPVI